MDSKKLSSRVYLLSLRQILGATAQWVVRQSPYIVPDNLTEIMQAVRLKFESQMPVISTVGDLRIVKLLSPHEVHDFIDTLLKEVPEIEELNTPKSRHNGLLFVTRDSAVNNPDDDFIDLDALARNIANSVIAEEDRAASLHEEREKRYAEDEASRQSGLCEEVPMPVCARGESSVFTPIDELGYFDSAPAETGALVIDSCPDELFGDLKVQDVSRVLSRNESLVSEVIVKDFNKQGENK